MLESESIKTPQKSRETIGGILNVVTYGNKKELERQINPVFYADSHINMSWQYSGLSLGGEPYLTPEEKGYYIISPVNGLDKSSDNYMVCTGLLVTGKKKGANQYVSFLTHQDWGALIKDTKIKDSFKEDLRNSLKKMKDICEEDTVVVGFWGGHNNTKYDAASNHTKTNQENYEDAKTTIGEIAKSIFPKNEFHILAKPSTNPNDSTEILFKQQDNELHIYKPKSD